MKENSFNGKWRVWDQTDDHKAVFDFAVGYKKFLDQGKTEREAAERIVETACTAGFVNLTEFRENERKIQSGDRVFAERGGKAVAMFVIGERPITQGLHFICSHIDAPRLDVRSNPLCESDGIAQLKTHYYGGIKKYQWVAQPLALHGVVVKKGGERVQVSVGEEENEPVFYISDLPKHLSAEQMKQPMADGIDGEHLNVAAGSIPLQHGSSENRVRKNVLRLLNQYYGVTEEDLASAELELVPAGKARDAGFDSSMIVSYGHDDRVCAYAALRAALEIKRPTYTSCVLFADKEEVGSVGSTGMNSHLLENFVAEIMDLAGESSHTALRLALENSKMLSADVVTAYDPSYSEAFESNNAARLGCGPVIVKYAGHMGKKNCNDASAEFIAYLRDIFDAEEIVWQTGEFGRIDLGGGGTIAPFAATYGMQVADCGVALLSMHAPYELVSKADVYETYRAYKAYLKSEADLGAYFSHCAVGKPNWPVTLA